MKAPTISEVQAKEMAILIKDNIASYCRADNYYGYFGYLHATKRTDKVNNAELDRLHAEHDKIIADLQEYERKEAKND